MTVSSKLSQILQSEQAAVEVANLADQAYNELTGGTYMPFTDADEAKVQDNVVGLYAAVNAAHAINKLRSGEDKDLLTVISDITVEKLTDTEKTLCELFANATWRARNTSKGLKRVTRATCVDFASLPPEEQVKDMPQIVVAAKFLLAKL